MKAPSPRTTWFCLALIGSTVLVYARVWTFDLVSYDDLHYIMLGPFVSKGLTWSGFLWSFTTFYFTNWHPLTWLSYMIDVQLFGVSPGALHTTNLILHIVASLLLFRWLLRLTGAWAVAALTASFFALHPLHVESVAWISERKDVLSALFLMLALDAYTVYVRGPNRLRYALIALWFALGLMAKPMVVTFPLLLLLLDYWPLRRLDERRPLHLLIEKLPLFALAAVSCVLTMKAQTLNVAKLENLRFSLRAANAAGAYVAYMGKMFWPSRLAIFYPYPARQSGWTMLVCLFLLAALTLAALREYKRRPYLIVGWLWYVGTLVPVIGLLQVGDQAMADRYTYIPLIGLFLILAYAAGEAAARRGWETPVLLASLTAVAASGVVAHAQVQHWNGDKRLWTHALEVTKRNYIAEAGLGTVYLSEGNLAKAIEHYKMAARLEPLYAKTHNNLGATLVRFGHAAEALPYLYSAVTLRPTYSEAHNNLGMALADLGDLTQAAEHYRKALEIQPNYAEVHSNLGITLARQGKSDEALSHFQSALKLNPEYADAYYNEAVVYFERGMKAKALESVTAALRFNPDHAEARKMWSDLQRGS